MILKKNIEVEVCTQESDALLCAPHCSFMVDVRHREDGFPQISRVDCILGQVLFNMGNEEQLAVGRLPENMGNVYRTKLCIEEFGTK